MEPISDERRSIVLEELTRKIVEQSIRAARSIASGSAQIVFPPDASLTPDEAEGLDRLEVDAATERAVCKIVADAMLRAGHDWFCVLDSVSEPDDDRIDPWLGVALGEPDENVDQDFLHDDFIGAWWDVTDRNDVV